MQTQQQLRQKSLQHRQEIAEREPTGLPDRTVFQKKPIEKIRLRLFKAQWKAGYVQSSMQGMY